jgi:hypothetical protein
MPGFGQFKLTDALPRERLEEGPSGAAGGGQGQASGRGGKNRRKGKGRAERGALAEPSRDAGSAQARHAELSTRDRMVDIGRGNQQAGRQGGK